MIAKGELSIMAAWNRPTDSGETRWHATDIAPKYIYKNVRDVCVCICIHVIREIYKSYEMNSDYGGRRRGPAL